MRAWRAADTGGKLVIDGPQQKRVGSFKKQLEVEEFKKELPVFLMKNWSSSHLKPLLENRVVYLGVMEECTRYFVEDGVVKEESVDSLKCNHAEADTRVIIHMIEADKSTPGDIVIRASDTDILVLLLYHLHRITSTVWMEVGTTGRGNRRYINVTKIAAEIGPAICAALPGLQAFTGCDYTSAFARKGKSRPYEIVSKTAKFQKALGSLSHTVPTAETVKVLQDFVCVLYGARKVVPLNKHRFNMVDRTYRQKSTAAHPFDKLKSIDGSSIPPCEAELALHVDRSVFVARLWGSAHQRYMDKMPTNGWDNVDGEFRINWFEGEQLPPVLVPALHVDDTTDGNESTPPSHADDEEDEDYTPLPTELESSDENDTDDDGVSA